MARKILVVEDEAPIRDMLCFVLEQNGYQAATAEDFDSAINALVEPYPDLVLLDWMLPGGSGVFGTTGLLLLSAALLADTEAHRTAADPSR